MTARAGRLTDPPQPSGPQRVSVSAAKSEVPEVTELSASHLLNVLPWALVVVLALVLWALVSWFRRLLEAEARRPLFVAFVLWLLNRHRR